jgi:ubiquitin-conjugating enzyme E2 J2
VIVKRDEPLSFHFVFYNLEEEYKQGFYHGVLELPEDYPFSPPKIKFLTNNGRFQVDKSICTTFTHYHKETWSSSWNIRTILTAMISFMYSDEKGIGGVFETSSKRKQLAAKSLQ